ncbi:virulence plasmid 28 protein [Pseudomonas sp. MG-9]|uniref:Tc toxin subunit A n=1 Tax=Pseudomonas sp. MG-9 TaxID=2839032 RepID=UPI001C002EFE|nr:Tc toxin subunit A [Pseudomonas sp. MG-9]MBT9268322.1 virulence plasmid 28 protein [Pseudomonas sp. MG-9]
MNASDNRPVHQLVKAVLGERSGETPSSFDEFIAQNPSVFELIKQGPIGLQAMGLGRQESHALITRGKALALYIARQFREQSLRALPAPGDDQALVPLPTYKEQFQPDVDAAAPAGSPEHSASTTAYMVALREWVRDYIVPQGEPGQTLPLDERRPDVDALLIDEMAINRVQSRLEVVNSVLEAQIRSTPGFELPSIKAYLRTIRFHNSLPYDHDWESISHVVGAALKDGVLGDIIRRVDLSYPYFKNPGARGASADVAMQLSGGIGPLKLSLLLEDPYFPLNATMAGAPLRRVDPLTRRVDPDPQASAGDFYLENFGDLARFLPSLRRLWIFRDATRLDQRQVDCLLGRVAFTPKLSANAPVLGDPDIPLTGETAGAWFINDGAEPAIDLVPARIGGLFEMIHVGEGDTALEHRMDRINRKCRLDRMLQLPGHQVDQLLKAAMHAERRGTGEALIWIRPNTLRCLGLFKELNRIHDCKAEEFAALIDVLSVYGQDGQLSHFDRVYNRDEVYEVPLFVDDVEFAIMPRTQLEQQTVHQICSALEINFETYRYLAMVIAEAYGLKTHLRRSLKILSSFWRLVFLGRLFGITPIESTALLQTLSEGEGLAAQLAGEPAVSSYGSADGADALSAIRGLMTCANWCREYDLSPLWLVQNINPVYVPTVWTESQEQLLRQLRSQVQAVRVDEASLLEAGAPLRDSNQQLIQWLRVLEPLVDADGLVIGSAEEAEDQYLERATAEIKDIVSTIYPGQEDADRREALETLVRTIVLRCRDEQRVVVEEGISVYLKLDSLLATQVLSWAQGHPYDFLKEAMSLQPAARPREQRVPEQPDSFLQMLTELERRGRIADKLALSPQMLATLLTGEQYQWFSLESPYEISIRSVYYLALYRRVISRARQPEEKILDYLSQVNQLPDDMSEDGLRLVRDAAADKLATYFGCGIRHVLECAKHITLDVEDSDSPAWPILRSLAHFDLLERTLELARQGMDITAALSLGALSPLDSEPLYASAAQNALESLARFNATTTPQDSAEVGQSFTTRCVVDNATLIANLPQEVAEFEITLRDFYGNPLKQVDIETSTDLGAMLTPFIRTDDEGRAWARLQAGARKGTAHFHYWLPLHEPIYGPSVLIDCDEATLKFNSELSGLPPRDPVLAGRLREQEMHAVLIDDHGNRGAHRHVAWSTTLGEIRPSQTFTDKDGVSRVWISSLSPGNAYITVSNVEGSHSLTFSRPIVFANKPRILDIPSITAVAMVGHALQVRCQVVGLDDGPIEGEKVVWWTSADSTEVERLSDADGFSDFSVADPQQGELTVFAKLGTDPRVEVMVWVASDAVIQNYSEVIRFPVVGASRPTLLWVDVKESSAANAKPVSNYPVMWRVDSNPPVEITLATDAQGRSVYPFTSATAGNFVVTADLALHPGLQTFNLTVLKAFEWQVELITIESGVELPPVPIIPGPQTLTLFRNSHYRLKISPIDATQLKGSQGALGWAATYSTRELGMVFTPPLATRFEFTDAPYEVEIQIANIRNGQFQLSLFCDRLNEALVLEGTLTKRPVTRRSTHHTATRR